MTRHGQLRDFFRGVGVKRLSAVDANPRRSNQHEVGTTRKMRMQFLGEEQRRCFPATYVWLGGDRDSIYAERTATHYDAREGKPRRPEWRLYYQANPVTHAMREGDALFLALTRHGRLYFIVAAEGTTSERQLSWLFGMRPANSRFESRELLEDESGLGFAARFVLRELGIEFEDPDAVALDGIVERFERNFPGTAEFSHTARLTLPHVHAEDDPDAALIAWLNHEEALFRRLEKHIVSTRLEDGFADDDGADVDGFVRYSLSVQNRRKSRMGQSLEHHLEAIFRALDIAHVRGAVTENNQRPDFLFPSAEVYRSAPATGLPCLTMLGAKSSCKDRWRQVLAEAAKIPKKHLLTLEPGISVTQTAQMKASNLQLVVPKAIQESYTDNQRAWLWTLDEFILDVRRRATR